MAGYPKVQILHTAPPDESLEQPFQGGGWRRTTIEALPEDVLLEIFDFYRLDAMEQSEGRPWKWHRLSHVCRKWRRAIFRSPRRLGLRILCESRAPILSILKSWPTLPLVAKFKLDWRSRLTGTIPRNVMVALRRPDRLCEIDLHVTSSMLAPVVEVTQKPCRALEIIRITVEALTGPSVLVGNGFLGGSTPDLREIKLDGIAFPFPSIQQVLLSTNNLVELHLSKIPNDAYFSPNDLVTGLSTSVQLKQLTVDFFRPLPSSPSPSMTRPPPQRTTLPSLTVLSFHGASGYLDEFVAQIELPTLCKFSIRLFNDIFFEIPKFCQLIPRLNALKSPTRATVKHSVDFVGVYFEEGSLLSENCFFGTSCRQLDWQLSFVTQILSQILSLLSSVHILDIQSGDELPTGEEDVEPTQWVELFQLFTHVTQVYVSEKLVPSAVHALVAEDMTAEVLPELTSLQLSGYRRAPSVANVAGQFVTARRLSGRTISLTSGDKLQQQQLRRHVLLLQEWLQWNQQKLGELEQELKEQGRVFQGHELLLQEQQERLQQHQERRQERLQGLQERQEQLQRLLQLKELDEDELQEWMQMLQKWQQQRVSPMHQMIRPGPMTPIYAMSPGMGYRPGFSI